MKAVALGRVFILASMGIFGVSAAQAAGEESVALCTKTLRTHADVSARPDASEVEVGWFTDTVTWKSPDIECKVNGSGVDYLRIGGKIFVIDGFSGAEAKVAYKKMGALLDDAASERTKAFLELAKRLDVYEGLLKQPKPDVGAIFEKFEQERVLFTGEFYKAFYDKNIKRIELLNTIEASGEKLSDSVSENVQKLKIAKQLLLVQEQLTASKAENERLTSALTEKSGDIDALRARISVIEAEREILKREVSMQSVPKHISTIKKDLSAQKFADASQKLVSFVAEGIFTEENFQELETAALRSVKPIPSSDVAGNRAGYEFLATLRPENQAYAAKVSQYSGVMLGENWVKDPQALHPTLFSCPSVNCGEVGATYDTHRVEVFEVRQGFARITEYYDVLCENGKIVSDIDSGRSDCNAENGVTNGKIARWIEVSYLSAIKPREITPRNDVENWVKGSDDFSLYREQFAKAAETLVKSGKCTQSDFQDNGGWSSSPAKGRGMYFIWCKNLTEKHYLDARTGRID